jgi:hypothetical protein
MAGEKPLEGRIVGNLELSHYLTLAVRTSRVGDGRDPIKHEHGGQRELGVASPKQLAARARQQVFVLVATPAFRHCPLACPQSGQSM